MAKGQQLTIVTTCTNKKRGKAPESCQLSQLSGVFYRDAAKKWVCELSEERVTRVPARDLYVGSHWQESLACQSTAESLNVSADLWVMSAGYGLVSGEERLSPYAAAFAAGSDSVLNLAWPSGWSTRQKVTKWWGLLHRHRGTEGLRRLTTSPEDPGTILLILSREYYRAVEDDIIDLISQGQNVAIVSAGMYRERNSAAPVVRPHILPFSDRFKQVDSYLDKTNTSLNARLAHWLVENHSSELLKGVDTVFPLLKEIEKGLPDIERKPVNGMTDTEVLAYIAANYSGNGDSATRLLRKLRHEEKRSCEQKRFGGLFRHYVNSLHGDFFDHV